MPLRQILNKSENYNECSYKTENISYIYGEGTPFEIRALDDVSVNIESSKIVALIGHTGSGKSTLIQHLNALLKPDSGRV